MALTQKQWKAKLVCDVGLTIFLSAVILSNQTQSWGAWLVGLTFGSTLTMDVIAAFRK